MSEVDICNLALAHLGDTAQVMSIKPPDSSVQAQLCARFYPMALTAVLEMGSWGFATRRIQLALVTLPTFTDANGNTAPGMWQYGYQVPSDMVNAIAVLYADAPNDYEAQLGAGPQCSPPYPQGYVPLPGATLYMPQPYALETLADGTQVLLTNVPDAVFRYTVAMTDTTKFSPLFTLALSYLLASMLAGPIIKGSEGAQKGTEMLQIFKGFEGMAESSDANQRRVVVEPSVSWIRGR